MVFLMEIKYGDNYAEFEINFNFYDYVSIIEAAKEFVEISYVLISGHESGKSLKMRFEPKDKSLTPKEVVHSFFNYALGIVNGRLKSSL